MILLTAAGQAPEKVQSLIDQLGAKAFVQRQEARRTLSNMGVGIVPLLEKATTHEDPETRLQAKETIVLIFRKAIHEVKVIGHHQGGGHRGWVTRAIFSSDGKTLITGGNSEIRVWNMQKGPLRVFNQGSETWSLAFSPDESKLVAGGAKSPRIFDWKTGRLAAEE